MDLSISYIISQILVVVYYLIYSYTFHLKDNKKILIYGIIATTINSISYLLLGAYTGMAMCFIAIFRNVLFYEDRRGRLNLFIIITLTILASIYTFNEWFSIFSILATIIYTYAVWQEDTKKYKLLGIIVNGLMIIYSFYIKSIMGTVLITISFISAIIGYIRTIKKKGENI